MTSHGPGCSGHITAPSYGGSATAYKATYGMVTSGNYASQTVGAAVDAYLGQTNTNKAYDGATTTVGAYDALGATQQQGNYRTNEATNAITAVNYRPRGIPQINTILETEALGRGPTIDNAVNNPTINDTLDAARSVAVQRDFLLDRIKTAKEKTATPEYQMMYQ
jgi:hypothetical protein